MGCKTFIEKMLMFEGMPSMDDFLRGGISLRGVAFGQCTGVKNVNFQNRCYRDKLKTPKADTATNNVRLKLCSCLLCL